jgi:hypothetical protein
MRRLLRENGLSLVTFGLFVVFLFGQSVAGWHVRNQEEEAHQGTPGTYVAYLASGDFLESVSENWESEFFQMAMFVALAVKLRQKGSPESNSVDEREEVDREPDPAAPDAPWPVRRGGLLLTLYSHSLSGALFLLFAFSFAAHAWSGAIAFSQEQQQHGEQAVGVLQYLATSRFWFESFQNWQSEFLAVGMLAVLAIVLREKGSSQSKPVDAPHDETGQGKPRGEQPPSQPGLPRAA